MAILTSGTDLAKNVFTLHSVNEAGKPKLARPISARGKFNEVVASRTQCTIIMQARSDAHHQAQRVMVDGDPMRRIAPMPGAPYRMSGKRGKSTPSTPAHLHNAMRRQDRRFVLSRNRIGFDCRHAGTAVGLISKPRAAARRLRAAMLR